MGLEVWFKDDIRNILLGVELANAHLATRYSDDEVRAYRDGFRAALAATAVSFGIYTEEMNMGTIAAQTRMAFLPHTGGHQP